MDDPYRLHRRTWQRWICALFRAIRPVHPERSCYFARFRRHLGATLISYPSTVIGQAMRAMRIFLFPGARPDFHGVIRTIVRLGIRPSEGDESLEENLNQSHPVSRDGHAWCWTVCRRRSCAVIF